MALEIHVLRNTLNLRRWCPDDPEASPDLRRPQGWLWLGSPPYAGLDRGFIACRELREASLSALSVAGTAFCHACPGPGPAPVVQL